MHKYSKKKKIVKKIRNKKSVVYSRVRKKRNPNNRRASCGTCRTKKKCIHQVKRFLALILYYCRYNIDTDTSYEADGEIRNELVPRALCRPPGGHRALRQSGVSGGGGIGGGGARAVSCLSGRPVGGTRGLCRSNSPATTTTTTTTEHASRALFFRTPPPP